MTAPVSAGDGASSGVDGREVVVLVSFEVDRHCGASCLDQDEPFHLIISILCSMVTSEVRSHNASEDDGGLRRHKFRLTQQTRMGFVNRSRQLPS
eukprot:6745549-Ditylum_brightwellii.AAC.1